jgi:succinoglycan biosynthesis transport protein ExoP
MYRHNKATDNPARRPQDDRAPARPVHGSLLDDFFDDEEKVEAAPVQPQPTADTVRRDPPRAVVRRDGMATTFPGLARLDRIGLTDILGWARDGIVWIILAIILCVAAAMTYAVMTPSRYTSYTDIIVNPSNLNVVDDGVFAPNSQRDTQLLEAESKLRTLTSRNVLSRVVDEMQLDRDPEFIEPPPLGKLKEMFIPAPAGDNKIGALRSLGDRVTAERDPRSFVVTLAVWSGDAEKSVRLSQAIVRAFENELFQTASESSRKVVDDLSARLAEMRDNVTATEKRVEDFKRENGLQVANGEFVSNTMSGELNGQVLEAQQRLIQEESRLKQMESAIAQQRAASSPIFDSETMNAIRQQYSILQQQIGAMTLTYGTRHPRLATAGAERAMLERGMADEARRILQTVRTSVGEARSSLDALRSKAVAERANVFTDNDAQVRLRDLERDSRSAAAIYETYLTRTRQITEQQTINSTDVRVISQPVAANARNWPPGKLTFLILGGVAGTVLGLGIALALGLLRFLRGKYDYDDEVVIARA